MNLTEEHEMLTVTEIYKGTKHIGTLVKDSVGNIVHANERQPSKDVAGFYSGDRINFPWTVEKK